MNFCPICHSLGHQTVCHECMRKLYKCLHTIARLIPELDNELTKQTAKVSKMQRATGSSTPLVYSPDSSELTAYAWQTIGFWTVIACPWEDLTGQTLGTFVRFAFLNH